MEKVLVTGGAGYIGSVLVRLLLRGNYQVRVLDNLSFGGESIVELLNYDDFEYIIGDVRNREDVEKAMADIDYVIHLAAIVGDPACAKQPEIARSVNLDASKEVYKIAEKKGIKKFLFASTCSNYGKMNDPKSFVTEDSILSPVSLYAETKVKFESFLLEQPRTNICKPTCARFSTVYGLSPRIRFDLTVNEFTKELSLGRELIVFGEQFWRPYCHVFDLARSLITMLEAEHVKTDFNVFNVGNTEENYQKKMIVEEILKQIPDGRIKYIKKDEDPRNYRVSFERIKNHLGFETVYKVPDGIEQIIRIISNKFIIDPDESKFRNI